jgi:hypothetical protein
MNHHACHPERSEGPLRPPWITQTKLRDQRGCVRSLAVCATRDDVRAMIEGAK